MSDLKIKHIADNSEIGTNTYICYKGNRGFIIDANSNTAGIDKTIKDLGIEIEAVLLTHGHFDHIMSAKHLQDKGIKIYIHKNDAEKLYTDRNLGLFMNLKVNYLNADVLLNGNETMKIAGCEIKVINTPGHSSGGVSYIVDDYIFTGDTLFKLSYGRTDFYDGDFAELQKSIRKLLSIAGDYKIFCGHGEPTSLEYERKFNPIFVDGAKF